MSVLYVLDCLNPYDYVTLIGRASPKPTLTCGMTFFGL